MHDTVHFSNQVVLPDKLLPVEEQVYTKLEKKYKYLKYLSSAILFTFLTIGFLALAYFTDNELPFFGLLAIASIFILLILSRVIFISFGFPKKGYLLREKDISYQSGLFSYKLTTVPFNRIQHVEVSQNILEKAFKLSRVKIYTAGGSVSDLSIPGLKPERAHQIESFLLTNMAAHE